MSERKTFNSKMAVVFWKQNRSAPFIPGKGMNVDPGAGAGDDGGSSYDGGSIGSTIWTSLESRAKEFASRPDADKLPHQYKYDPTIAKGMKRRGLLSRRKESESNPYGMSDEKIEEKNHFIRHYNNVNKIRAAFRLIEDAVRGKSSPYLCPTCRGKASHSKPCVDCGTSGYRHDALSSDLYDLKENYAIHNALLREHEDFCTSEGSPNCPFCQHPLIKDERDKIQVDPMTGRKKSRLLKKFTHLRSGSSRQLQYLLAPRGLVDQYTPSDPIMSTVGGEPGSPLQKGDRVLIVAHDTETHGYVRPMKWLTSIMPTKKEEERLSEMQKAEWQSEAYFAPKPVVGTRPEVHSMDPSAHGVIVKHNNGLVDIVAFVRPRKSIVENLRERALGARPKTMAYSLSGEDPSPFMTNEDFDQRPNEDQAGPKDRIRNFIGHIHQSIAPYLYGPRSSVPSGEWQARLIKNYDPKNCVRMTNATEAIPAWQGVAMEPRKAKDFPFLSRSPGSEDRTVFAHIGYRTNTGITRERWIRAQAQTADFDLQKALTDFGRHVNSNIKYDSNGVHYPDGIPEDHPESWVLQRTGLTTAEPKTKRRSRDGFREPTAPPPGAGEPKLFVDIPDTIDHYDINNPETRKMVTDSIKNHIHSQFGDEGVNNLSGEDLEHAVQNFHAKGKGIIDSLEALKDLDSKRPAENQKWQNLSTNDEGESSSSYNF